MKRVLIQGALVLSAAAFGLPAVAQQAPINQANPSSPPATEGQNQPGHNMSSGQGARPKSSSNSSMSRSATDPNKGQERALKPRQQGTPRAPTADAPSGPKGDTPDPIPKQ
ncbi:hypothetical protein ACKI2N_005170 [Cupriavidus sp. 30B13]|uniref:hypothetical protein n=1 Tax=Cupriavidus sp. 30B13 TaxID=3384241 RepID=UPI003B917C29